jgi:hypothetical protein
MTTQDGSLHSAWNHILCIQEKKWFRLPIFLEGIKAFQKEKAKGDFIFPE